MPAGPSPAPPGAEQPPFGPPLFGTMAIIGPGLIGSSLLRRARTSGWLAEKLVAIDHAPQVLARVRELGLADMVTSSLAEGVREADLVILCVPVGAVRETALAAIAHMKPGALLSDVASVRTTLGPEITAHLPPDIAYVPVHPMAGTEHSGPDAGLADLFENRWCLVVPPEGTPAEAIRKVEAFWQRCGARTREVTDSYHDQICAMVSHLPHFLAFTICETADRLSGDLRSDVLEFAASGFRDFTRIAASDPVMWRDIFLANRDILLATLERFQTEVDKMATALREEDEQAIMTRLEHGRHIRKSLIANRQA
ncbi:prephenate dehydrogenase/arogenate dehydrogenase family protein [Oecophyllibacter saccharovorans]|uniref:Prephenate dehydrogenase/arogenate dehydrogenase family protein n=1 Tax=Oecophyllibacter saccharovorans TaxID=2558360 RepID=A0A506UQE5_9PROT|nr:prephenate dehydrogenase/arogenate dehydrogenase family protein [Oecophyllibacter saccharovorans]TPW35519.1 prephenate dehydrogenase/arogenate dehydrogenase family protein [Oecophyllibacter saccharovorans]